MNDTAGTTSNVRNLALERSLKELQHANEDLQVGVQAAFDAAQKINLCDIPIDRLKEFLTAVRRLKIILAMGSPPFAAAQNTEEASLGRPLTAHERQALLARVNPQAGQLFIS